jgi:uroporphyrinogen-III synthase
MINKTPHVLITRPRVAGKLLAEHLKTVGISSICLPLFDYQPIAKSTNKQQLIDIHHSAIIIFISVAAVDFAAHTYGLSQWKDNRVLAVGPKSQLALRQYNINAEIPLEHNSEGLLNHSLLAQVKNQDVIIVRGDGGRELLAQNLTSKGANVFYLQTYRRHWRLFTNEIAQKWQKNKINCIVVTSSAILEQVMVLMNTTKAQWKSTCLWVVASQRIKVRAIELGLVNVVNANGANDEAITAAIRQYGMKS